MMYEYLRKVPLFANLSEQDLQRLCTMVEEVHLQPGEVLFEEGSRGDKAYIIREGELDIIKTSGERPVLLVVRGSGEVIGEMALLEDVPRVATVRSRGHSILLAIGQEQFDQLLDSSVSASRSMMNTVLTRWRSLNSLLRQSEKMAQMGTLTAGIAHELNNPAAAVRRGASQLEGAIGQFAEAHARITHMALKPEQQSALLELTEQAKRVAARPLMLDAIVRSDREAELESWLEERGVEDAWELAPELVNLGIDQTNVGQFAGRFESEQLAAVVSYLSCAYSMYNLLAEVGMGAGRISDIVKALKSYSYLDQAPVQAVDIHEGIDNTLLILRHKLKNDINVRREYAEDLPKVQGHGSELNQVWTNIIDNAADALAGRPGAEITIRTRREKNWVVIEIADNGPGIPPEIQSRVFDAFFTTKPPGKGTGLGLDISYNIVTSKHKGDIKLFSVPGLTSFTIWLPINPDSSEESPPVASFVRAGDSEMRRILETSKTVAVVGLSGKENRPAHDIPAYLQRHGYRVIPVNPYIDEALGETAYPDLKSVPEPVDVVQIFRPSEEVLPHAQAAIEIGAKAIWMQSGIINEQAARIAREAGLTVVMDACMMVNHKRLIAS